jgi:RNA 2',3'-cyclic 3'-phosphodiesterase
MTPMRLFFAVNFVPEVREELAMMATTLRAAAPSVSWVPEPRLHLTVRFLGETAESLVPALAAGAEQVAGRFAPFSMAVGGAGAFPNLRAPRVVWFGVEPHPKLELMHHELELQLGGVGLEPDGRPFRPHVTIGRCRGKEGRDELAALRKLAAGLDFTLETEVRSLDLMQSTGGAHAAPYRCLASAHLG